MKKMSLREMFPIESREGQPETLIIPNCIFNEDPDVFEKACEICGIDPETTKLEVIL